MSENQSFKPDLSLIYGLTNEFTLGQLGLSAGELDSSGLSAESDHAPYPVTKVRRMYVKELRESLENPDFIAPSADADTELWEARQQRAS